MSVTGKSIYQVLYDEHPLPIYTTSPNPKPYLRLRDLGTGRFAIVRVGPYQQFGNEIVATDLSRADAERLLNLSKEK